LIDAATADAADHELDVAATALPASDPDARSKFVLALKKVRGLVEGLAGLTEKVAAAINAVHGLQ
jgi:hypothetical protein